MIWRKYLSNMICTCIIAAMLLTIMPQPVHAAGTDALSGKNEAWMWPLGPSNSPWLLTSHFGYRSAGEGASKEHQGIDISCGIGTKVYAAKSGVVCGVGSGDGRGIFIRIDHRDGTYSQYQHLKSIQPGIAKNSEVKQGDVIGLSGNTGGIGTAHLHFQINTDGNINAGFTTPLNSMPANEGAFKGLHYINDACPNPIPGKWLRDWQNCTIYRDMGITDTNTYNASLYYPNPRPANSSGVVETYWPPIYTQSRIRYYFAPSQKIVLSDRATYPAFEATPARTTVYKVSVDFLQECLHDLGYNIVYDGFHGPNSTNTVKSFQAKYGLSQTGDIDQQTWDKVIELMHAKYPEKPVVKPLDITDPTTYPSFNSTIPAYTSGTATYNKNTEFVQRCLKDLGYTIDVDGYHGPGSTAVVKTFQKDINISISGSINQETWDCLVALMTLKYHVCIDADKDHACDICESPIGVHEASVGTHICNYCGQAVTDCTDQDTNHACDVCGVQMGAHAAPAGTHICNYCGQAVTDCTDQDTNHACDVCGVQMGTHEAPAGTHICNYCGQAVTDCTDQDTNHACDVCGVQMGAHEAPAGTHICNYCGNTMSSCVDANNDNLCDICIGNMGKVYTVTFVAGEGLPAPDKQTVHHAAHVAKPIDPEWEDHVFVGWTTDLEGTCFWDFTLHTVTEDTILYAQWKQHQWGSVVYQWSTYGCTVKETCVHCSTWRETPVSFELTAETLTMSRVPDDLQLFIAGYSADGQMIGCQIAHAAEIIHILIPGNTAETAYIRVFFLNENGIPLRVFQTA